MILKMITRVDLSEFVEMESKKNVWDDIDSEMDNTLKLLKSMDF